MPGLIFLPPAAKYLKKLKDKKLKSVFEKCLNEIIRNPFIGEKKQEICKACEPADLITIRLHTGSLTGFGFRKRKIPARLRP